MIPPQWMLNVWGGTQVRRTRVCQRMVELISSKTRPRPKRDAVPKDSSSGNFALQGTRAAQPAHQRHAGWRGVFHSSHLWLNLKLLGKHGIQYPCGWTPDFLHDKNVNEGIPDPISRQPCCISLVGEWVDFGAWDSLLQGCDAATSATSGICWSMSLTQHCK